MNNDISQTDILNENYPTDENGNIILSKSPQEIAKIEDRERQKRQEIIKSRNLKFGASVLTVTALTVMLAGYGLFKVTGDAASAVNKIIKPFKISSEHKTITVTDDDKGINDILLDHTEGVEENREIIDFRPIEYEVRNNPENAETLENGTVDIDEELVIPVSVSKNE